MFYWTWHAVRLPTTGGSATLRRFSAEHPEAIDDYDHPAWDIGGNSYFWDEPLLGYYKTTDPWVLRKHAEMLADAGVDVVFFDCTNASLTWKSSYDVLIDVWTKAQGDGVNVPKIAFMLPFGPWIGRSFRCAGFMRIFTSRAGPKTFGFTCTANPVSWLIRTT